MSPRRLSLAAFAVLSVCLSQFPGFGAEAAASDPLRPDPNEIPVPPIETRLGSLPGPSDLPFQKDLPDYLVMNDGTRVTTQAQWQKRREEIRKILEYYHVGRMPPPPGNVTGHEISSQLVMGGKARYRLIHLSFGPDEKLGLDIGIFTPTEGGPFPTVIMPGGPPPGSKPLPRLAQGPTQGRGLDVLLVVGSAASAETGREGTGAARPKGGFGFGPTDAEAVAARNPALAHGYAYVTFNTNDCAEDTTLRNPDGSWAFRTTRFFPAYPGYDWGIIGGWVWGTMRVVDYLQNDPSIDRTKLIITGVSRIGKAAMISGAFDDRIALVAPVASSGLGTPAYRYSGLGRGGKEGLIEMMRKYPNQFSPHLHEFWGQVDRLPYDADWFQALAAPRPFIAIEGTRDQNVVADAVERTWIGAQKAYALFNATEKVGVYWSDRPHGMGPNDWEGLLAFADKHLLGKRTDKVFNLFPVVPTGAAPAGE